MKGAIMDIMLDSFINNHVLLFNVDTDERISYIIINKPGARFYTGMKEDDLIEKYLWYIAQFGFEIISIKIEEGFKENENVTIQDVYNNSLALKHQIFYNQHQKRLKNI